MSPNRASSRLGLSTSEAARHLGVSLSTVRRWSDSGHLVGYRTLHGVSGRIGSPRAEVANTIAYRRRKGTASMLEQLARDVTGGDARVVEFFQRLGWSGMIPVPVFGNSLKHINHTAKANDGKHQSS